jgi:3-oxoacyl-[acyl-carrier-protein] synthase-3
VPAVPAGFRGAAITGWGSSVPDKIVTNDDLAATMDTSDAWITERTGIKERRVGGTTSQLATEAGQAALARAGVEPGEIDLLLLATTTPDQAVPGTSPTVQKNLGLRCGAVDLNAACSGFVYGLAMAHGVIAAGAGKVLLIGAETLSRITDWSDRGTAILFADGAAGVVIEAVDGPGQLLSWDLDADGTAQPYLYADIGDYLRMDGREVFRRAVRIMVDSATKALTAAGVGAEDIALLVPHQANIRIIDAACQRLGIPIERTATNIDRFGNTSAASIPMAFAEALDAGRVSKGDLVLLCGFGAGMTAGSAVLRWGGS